MTAHPKEEFETIISQEISILEQLHTLLQREQTALKELNYQEIQQMSEEKLVIEEKLHALAEQRNQFKGTLSAVTQTKYDKIVESIKQVWQVNSLRFRVSLDIITSLTDVLTGVQRPSYGPRATTGHLQSASPVLTNEVG